MRSILTISIVLSVLCGSCALAGVLDDLAKPRDYRSKRISSYDRHGGNADGGQANPMKVGETRTLADIEGPGEIAHIWFTLAPFDKDVMSNVILRMYWDGERTPSMETPIGAFFGLGHGKESSFDSLPISVANNRGLNSFFPMPFNRRARITLENQSGQQLWALYYYIDYKEFPAPTKDIRYFHAQYRQAKPELSRDNYVALEAEGKGHFVGMFYYIRSNSGGWWGEGDDMIYIDGDTEPTLYGTGMEDYFLAAWGMKQGQDFMRSGSPLFEVYLTGDGNENTAYRWHLEDAVAFSKSIRVTHEHGSHNDRNDDFFSVAFWYQAHPRASFPRLPSKFDRLSFTDKQKALLEQGRVSEYRALLTDFVTKAVDPDAKTNIMTILAEHYVSAGDKDSARGLLQSQLGPMPVQGWADHIKKIAEKAAIEGLTYPGGEVTLVPCGVPPILTEVGGSRCYRTERSNASQYMVIKVHDGNLRDVEKDLVLEVDCYSDGSGRMLVEYNSTFEGDVHDTKYHRAEVAMPTSRGWHTVRVDLPRAKLVRSQNCEGDMRISNTTGDLYVRGISVKAK